MFTISKEFHFSASHKLKGLLPDHPCSRLHGHNYVVIVYIKGRSLNKAGMVVDYNELKPIKDWIDQNWDHRDLNSNMVRDYHKVPISADKKDKEGCYYENPTAENMAKYLYDLFKPQFPEINAIGIKETPKTFAYYEPSIFD